jgi:hypothetical protein
MDKDEYIMEADKYFYYQLAKKDEMIKNLRTHLDLERKNVRKFKQQSTNHIGNRADLENLFLECIEVVKKDIIKRKSLSTSYISKR